MSESLWDLHSERLTEERRKKMQSTAEARTDRICLVLQDVQNPHNISACVRSADAFGIQNVHVIDRENMFKKSTVSKGVDRWLDIHKYKDIASCVKSLKEKSYKILAAMPNPDNCTTLYEIPLDEKIAILFSNEHEGLSEDFKPYIDAYFTIPMVGMVESLNISVCAAIAMNHIRERAKISWGKEFFLNKEEKTRILDQWVKKQFRDL